MVQVNNLFLLYSGQNYVFLGSVAHLVMQSDTSLSLLATTFYQFIHKVRCILKTATILSLLGLRAVLKWQQSNQLEVACALQLVLSILCLCSVLFHQDFFIFLLYSHLVLHSVSPHQINWLFLPFPMPLYWLSTILIIAEDTSYLIPL